MQSNNPIKPEEPEAPIHQDRGWISSEDRRVLSLDTKVILHNIDMLAAELEKLTDAVARLSAKMELRSSRESPMSIDGEPASARSTLRKDAASIGDNMATADPSAEGSKKTPDATT
ncbi:hypothetical protein G7Z17_g4519 [Cylindrodendrum hubeiense]|uniref:Uncharacterized protein n=1 Tax=Cylindrodendrum hubeiense TaxID=595255 RepID=A0A9P5LI88_9HYPO|nr:hypothetical protein G7Z17_g4519 [Cylindrodendrum hubeiense]